MSVKNKKEKNLSVVINTYNEAHHIRDCILSVQKFADEIVVSDMESEDGSAKIAEELGCIVFSCKKLPAGEYTLIERIKRANGKWVLMLDPDMRVPEITGKKILEIIMEDYYDGATFYMRNFIFGQLCNHGHGSQGKFFKLFRRSNFIENIEMGMGISFGIKHQLSKGKILDLSPEFYIEHYAYNDMYTMFAQHLRYADTIAREQANLGKHFSIAKLCFLPLKKFVVDVLFNKGWEDGIPGISYTLAASSMLFFKELLLWYYSNRQK